MKENRLLFKEGEPIGSLEAKDNPSKKNEPLSKNDEDRFDKARLKAEETRERSEEQRKIDDAEAEELLRSLEEPNNAVENRLVVLIDKELFNYKAISDNAADYIVTNISSIRPSLQEDLANVLFMTGNLKNQNLKVFFKLVKAIEGTIGVKKTETILLAKINSEVENLKNAAGRTASTDLLKTLSDNPLRGLVSSEQWKDLWDNTAEKDRAQWRALALPNQEGIFAQKS